MSRFVMLVKFTDKGIAAVKDSPARASQFKTLAAQKGVTVETHFWLQGEYDGMMVLSAPTEEPITALALSVGGLGFVRTCLCRAYDESEFKGILGRL